MAIYEIKDEKEKLILVGVASSANDDTEQSLDELCDLVDTAGDEIYTGLLCKNGKGTGVHGLSLCGN